MTTINHGDCLDVMRAMDADSIDAVVTDPPAGIAFMGRSWDSDRGGRKQWIAWMTEVMAEALRVAKPGAHAVVWALPRTSHWTMTAIEDAGWECRDVITHMFGSGFPKSRAIGKDMDRQAGQPRSRVPLVGGIGSGMADDHFVGGSKHSPTAPLAGTIGDDAPATDDTRAWDGWGTALKPAAEFWILARKPLSERSVAGNVLRWHTGALHIDGCRISAAERPVMVRTTARQGNSMSGPTTGATNSGETTTLGRWPANVVLSHSPGCVEVGTRKVKVIGATAHQMHQMHHRTEGIAHSDVPHEHAGYRDADGTETVPAWECEPDCAVRLLDEQTSEMRAARSSGMHDRHIAADGRGVWMGTGWGGYVSSGVDDRGGASRFFYCSKASSAERSQGLDTRSTHPTVKPVNLMAYLIRLVTPPGGVVLDPFLGSGTTAVAAIGQGFECIGIEQSAEYVAIAEQRIGLGCDVRRAS